MKNTIFSVGAFCQRNEVSVYGNFTIFAVISKKMSSLQLDTLIRHLLRIKSRKY